MKTEWWEGFLSELWLDIVRGTPQDELDRAEVDFIEKVLQLQPEAKVLDVACGEGRHALELASRGYHITGLDIALPLLEEARRKATERQLEITWEHRDMRDLPWQEEFDGVFCFLWAFSYFDEEEHLDFLKAVHRTLKPEGRFLFDTALAETLFPTAQANQRVWWGGGETLVLEQHSYDHVRSRADTEWTFVHEGKVEKKQSSQRIYTYREVLELLEEVGFAEFEGYGSLSQEQFRFGSKRLYMMATKEGA
ncbi:MAG: SAM-dependent methyltransferase [Candidatus Geothermarchaeales archaeon]